MKSWARALRAASSTSRGLRLRLAVGDVVAHRVVEEDGLLRHLGNLAAQARPACRSRMSWPSMRMRARGHVKEARNQVDQRGFARAAGPHDRQHLAGAHFEIHVVQNLVLALFGRVGKAHVLKLDGLLKALQRGQRADAPSRRPWHRRRRRWTTRRPWPAGSCCRNKQTCALDRKA